jgi:hypothetical protein
LLTGNDREDLSTAKGALDRIISSHESTVTQMIINNQIANIVSTKAADLAKIIRASATDAQKIRAAYLEDKELAVSTILDAIKLEHATEDFEFADDVHVVKPVINPVASYQFVTRARTAEVTKTYLSELPQKVLRSTRSIDFSDVTHESVKDAIARYPDDEGEDSVEVLRKKLYAEVEKDFTAERVILREGDDVSSKLSEGFNARIYFSLMADEQLGKGLYIVDQPEDQISQKSIKESVLNDFRDIAQTRQVILITHNPQFIVNLDVDNVIFLERKDNSIVIKSGALEYEDDDYRMLDVVAENVEGGLETIQRRMKRYEKTY